MITANIRGRLQTNMNLTIVLNRRTQSGEDAKFAISIVTKLASDFKSVMIHGGKWSNFIDGKIKFRIIKCPNTTLAILATAKKCPFSSVLLLVPVTTAVERRLFCCLLFFVAFFAREELKDRSISVLARCSRCSYNLSRADSLSWNRVFNAYKTPQMQTTTEATSIKSLYGGGQGTHAIPVGSMWEPAGHFVHPALTLRCKHLPPAEQNFGIGHNRHCASSNDSSVRVYLPATQSTHAVEPACLLHVPEPHFSQAIGFCATENFPFSHGAHFLSVSMLRLVATYAPPEQFTLHSVQEITAVCPVWSPYFP